MLLSCIDVSLSFSLKAMKKMSSGEGYKKKVSQINVLNACGVGTASVRGVPLLHRERRRDPTVESLKRGLF